MRLVVSEKPSVARSIAAVLGATQKQKDYLEGNNYLVSWCVGHLVELAAPAAYDEKYAKWSTAIAAAALCYGETIIFFTAKKKELTAAIAMALLKDGRVMVKGLYSPKTGKTYDATVVLDDTGE